MVPQKFRKNSLQLLKISVKARFPIFKLPFSFNFIYCMLWFWQRFWEPRNIFFWIFMLPYKIPHLCNNKNTIWLKIYTCFLSEITIYNFPTCPGWPCRFLSFATIHQCCGMKNKLSKFRIASHRCRILQQSRKLWADFLQFGKVLYMGLILAWASAILPIVRGLEVVVHI